MTDHKEYDINFSTPVEGDQQLVVGLGVDLVQKLGGAFIGGGMTLREAITNMLDRMDRTYPGWYGGMNSTDTFTPSDAEVSDIMWSGGGINFGAIDTTNEAEPTRMWTRLYDVAPGFTDGQTIGMLYDSGKEEVTFYVGDMKVEQRAKITVDADRLFTTVDKMREVAS